MASRNSIERLKKQCTLNDLGELSLMDLVTRSGCSQHHADLALIGDEQTLERFLDSRKSERLALPEHIEPNYDVAGDFVDVGRYLSGEPECMFNYDGQYEAARFVDVIIRIGRPSKTPSSSVFKYYSNVLQAIDILESLGLRCRLTATLDIYYTQKKHRIVFKTPIKEYSEPINMAVFAGTILNNSFFTNVVCNVVDNHYGEYATGYSYCWDITDLEVPQTDSVITFPTLYFNAYSERGSYDFQDYMKVIGLSHLLQ